MPAVDPARSPALPARRLLRDRRGMALVEFGLTFPILVLAMTGAFEMSLAATAGRELTRLANSAATMLTVNTTGTITYLNLHYANDIAMLIFPDVLKDSASKGIAWGADISISMAGVGFSPTVTGCTSACAYQANIHWTGGAAARACGTHPLAAPDSAAPSATTLPTDLFTPVATPASGNAPPNFLVVVDVQYSWAPAIAAGWLPRINFRRSAYIVPRYVPAITYSVVAGDDGFGNECPGY